MPFMVIYSTSDGATCHEQADAIDEAALFVERLRNQDGIEEIHIFRMEEISFAFRPYYKVELGMPERLLTSSPPPEVFAPAPVADEAVVGPDPSEPVSTMPMPLTADVPAGGATADEAATADDGEATGANGRRGLFGR